MLPSYDTLIAIIILSIDINMSNNVGTNTSKQPAVAEGWGGSLHTNSTNKSLVACRLVSP